ncbi:ArsR/SmtB family transcription factor [Jeotgalibacillus campisalis]|uniref:ArsR/SmtB family transcription factor n=1 Tax=Jeotgalibacillus campisalis TaxID=220754 RepID=UPI000697A68B|nr:metalloregulator ArsR/SmtB family transcription factor [Jeotgalibacillus campisalis]
MRDSVLKPDAATFQLFEKKFKALADEKRLYILHLVQKHDSVCVCDLAEMIDMPQSKLSYHLKQLLDAQFVTVEKKGTWNYYSINDEELNGVLSDQLCCLFRNEDKC